jgi:hypothetical protein
MCKSLIVCLALVFGLVSTSSADILIGNFENSNSDSWVPGWEGTPELHSTTNGVTLQDMALCVKNTNWGYWTLQYVFPQVISLADVTAVQMDVTMLASEWSNDWTKVDKMSVNSNGASGWTEYQSTAIDRITGLPTTQSWQSATDNAYKTFTWDMSQDTYNIMDVNGNPATYLQLNFALQGPSNLKGGCFHIDNVRLVGDPAYVNGDLTGQGQVMEICVPEPMTIAMLGLGSLALLRKKQ